MGTGLEEEGRRVRLPMARFLCGDSRAPRSVVRSRVKLPAHNVLAKANVVHALLLATTMMALIIGETEALTLPPFFTRPPPSATQTTAAATTTTTTALNPTKTPLQTRDEEVWKAGSLQDQFGTSALGQVRNLAAAVQTAGGQEPSRRGIFVARGKNTGGTGSLMRSLEPNGDQNDDNNNNNAAGIVSAKTAEREGRRMEKDKTVVTALARLEKDSEF